MMRGCPRSQPNAAAAREELTMMNTRRRGAIALVLFACAGYAIAQNVPAGHPQNNLATVPLPATWPAPVNPHATPEARTLLRFIDSISGRYTLTGQHNFPNSSSRWTDRAYDLTGKYPALFGQDFGFAGGDDKDSVDARARDDHRGRAPVRTWLGHRADVARGPAHRR